MATAHFNVSVCPYVCLDVILGGGGVAFECVTVAVLKCKIEYTLHALYNVHIYMQI